MNVKVLGIPSHAGALYPGTDEAPQAIRRAGLVESLQKSGISVKDSGDLPIPSYLPRHTIGPIRNWPAPRIVWELMTENRDLLFEQDQLTLILGGDCSIIVGSVDCLTQLYGKDIHVILIDAHVDAVAPHPSHCIGAAGMGLWLLTRDHLFWQKNASFESNQLMVLACQSIPEGTRDIPNIPLPQLRDKGLEQCVQNLLSAIPTHSKILIHLDVDAIGKEEMPAAYSPSETGLTISELKTILSALIKDPRIVGIEITEFSAFRDADLISAKRIADLLTEVFSSKK